MECENVKCISYFVFQGVGVGGPGMGPLGEQMGTQNGKKTIGNILNLTSGKAIRDNLMKSVVYADFSRHFAKTC